MMEIPNLSNLLNGHINGPIISQDVSRLTAPGENYGSLMLKVDVKVQNNNQEETIHTVAKCVQPNKQLQKVFQTDITFRNEIGWYKEVIPTMLAFQKEKGVNPSGDMFMKIFGMRYNNNLDRDSQELDENGVILCENLITKGFKNIDRILGFDLDQSKEIIKKLAIFHSVTLAIKLEKPELFNQKIRPHLHGLVDNESNDYTDYFKGTIQTLKDNVETAPFVPRVMETINKLKETFSKQRVPQEPWATAIHTDFWVNNIMLKEEEENAPKIIILDLQTCALGSPIEDLIFFLAISVQTSTAENHFDELINLYYEELINNLRLLKADTTPFTYESFENELKREVPKLYLRIIFFIPIIMAAKGSVSDVTVEEPNIESKFKNMFCNVTEEQKQKHVYVVKTLVKRNWI